LRICELYAERHPRIPDLPRLDTPDRVRLAENGPHFEHVHESCVGGQVHDLRVLLLEVVCGRDEADIISDGEGGEARLYLILVGKIFVPCCVELISRVLWPERRTYQCTKPRHF
jgi:hypothetical protein